MPHFGQVLEDPDYYEEVDFEDEVEEDFGEEVFKRIVEELSPFETVNS